MRTTAFWTLYVGITILIGSVCHYHTGVEGRPGKSPAGKTVGKSLVLRFWTFYRIEKQLNILYIYDMPYIIICLMFETSPCLFHRCG